MKAKESVVGKALWFVENHFSEVVTLDDVAVVCGVGRHHLTRAFGIATGRPLMRYLWGRRLTEAARAMAGGAPDILAVALGAGYGSHEAFTRAFREEFGVTPEAVRKRRSVEGLALTEPLALKEGLWSELEAPRTESAGEFLFAGMATTQSVEIPAAWQRFAPHIGHIAGQVGWETYGVCDREAYVCAVAVRSFTGIPEDWAQVRVPAAKYLVFRHGGHVSTVRRTWFTIWNQWLPEAKYTVTGGPEFERYGREFDPRTGSGGLEIWIPVAN